MDSEKIKNKLNQIKMMCEECMSYMDGGEDSEETPSEEYGSREMEKKAVAAAAKKALFKE